MLSFQLASPNTGNWTSPAPLSGSRLSTQQLPPPWASHGATSSVLPHTSPPTAALLPAKVLSRALSRPVGQGHQETTRASALGTQTLREQHASAVDIGITHQEAQEEVQHDGCAPFSLRRLAARKAAKVQPPPSSCLCSPLAVRRGRKVQYLPCGEAEGAIGRTHETSDLLLRWLWFGNTSQHVACLPQRQQRRGSAAPGIPHQWQVPAQRDR